jgi:hypothetical protein
LSFGETTSTFGIFFIYIYVHISFATTLKIIYIKFILPVFVCQQKPNGGRGPEAAAAAAAEAAKKAAAAADGGCSSRVAGW